MAISSAARGRGLEKSPSVPLLQRGKHIPGTLRLSDLWWSPGRGQPTPAFGHPSEEGNLRPPIPSSEGCRVSGGVGFFLHHTFKSSSE